MKDAKNNFLVLVFALLSFSTATAYDVIHNDADNPWPLFPNPTIGMSESIGGYSGGCLAGAENLPPSGDGYFMMRQLRRRFFAHQDMTDFILLFAGQAIQNALLIGDVAQPRGGPFNGTHVSHQTGLDVDIWFQRRNDYPQSLKPNWTEVVSARSVVNLETYNLNENWDSSIEPLLIWVAQHPQVERFFVHPAIKKHFCVKYPNQTRLNKMRPWYGHDDHFHVRLKCPSQDKDCISQNPVPADPGCGAELDWWYSDEARRPPKSDKPVISNLPERCRQVAEMK